ncbi:nitrite reductase small subunit NirD [Emcibacter sp.]|uniref:nitrite reductase small subunit NirD n=1 Tax=Emcibacter sp. TaxID=1979954 RepID=UPI003A910D50
MTENWIEVGHVEDIPFLGSRVIKTGGTDIAVFKTSTGEVFALEDKCPHKGGPLSQGIVHGKSVSCPLHNWNISLENGEALGADSGCSHVIPVQIEGDRVLLLLPERKLVAGA